MDALETLTLESLQTMLAEAIQARHRLVTRPTSASSNDRSVTYQQRLSEADAYINRLRDAVNAKTGTGAGGGRHRPIYLTGGC